MVKGLRQFAVFAIHGCLQVKDAQRQVETPKYDWKEEGTGSKKSSYLTNGYKLSL